jgi:hypothetical protein
MSAEFGHQANDVMIEVHCTGMLLGDDLVRTERAITIASNKVTVIEGSAEEIESLLLDMLVRLRTFHPGHFHNLQVVDEQLRCKQCNRHFVDLDAAEQKKNRWCRSTLDAANAA